MTSDPAEHPEQHDLRLTLGILQQVRAVHAERLREQLGTDQPQWPRPLSIAEISTITGIPQSTLQDINDRALRKLRRRARAIGLLDE